MDSTCFNVIVRKKIPYVTNGLIALMFGFIFMFFLCNVLFLPVRFAPLEMKTAYFILVIPSMIKKLLALAVMGALVTWILQAIAREHRKAVLTFASDQITVEGKKLNMVFPLDQISRIYAEDVHGLTGNPKRKFKLDFIDKKQIATMIRLADYDQVEAVLKVLAQYSSLDIRLTEYKVTNSLEEEN
jgi:hypothetical protein